MVEIWKKKKFCFPRFINLVGSTHDCKGCKYSTAHVAEQGRPVKRPWHSWILKKFPKRANWIASFFWWGCINKSTTLASAALKNLLTLNAINFSSDSSKITPWGARFARYQRPTPKKILPDWNPWRLACITRSGWNYHIRYGLSMQVCGGGQGWKLVMVKYN